MTESPRELRMDDEIRRFLDWQSTDLGAAPGVEEMIDRVALRLGRSRGGQVERRLVFALLLLALLASLAASAVLLARPPAPIVIPPLGEQLVFMRLEAEGSGTIVARPADMDSEHSLPSGEACCPVWSHRGDLLMASMTNPTGQTTTVTMGADLVDPRAIALPDGTLNLGAGAWSPDDQRLALEGWDTPNPGRNGIYEVDAAGGANRVQLTTPPDGYHDLPLSYAPSGAAILFLRESARDTWHLFVVRTDGTGLRQLTTMRSAVGFGISPATWSPDSRDIAFAAFDPLGADVGRSAVFIVQLGGGEPRRISEWADYITSAQFSPDGQWIAYDQPDPPHGHNLWLVQPEGTQAHPITTNANGGQCCAQWSANGERLIFQKGPLGSELSDLWVINPDGSGLSQLTHSPATYAWYALNSP